MIYNINIINLEKNLIFFYKNVEKFHLTDFNILLWILICYQELIFFCNLIVYISTAIYLKFLIPRRSPIKLTVKSNFFKLSSPSKFSIISILFRAKFKYSNLFNLLRFSIFDMRLFCNNRIFICLHVLSINSIFTIFSWCNAISSRVEISPSLCSERFRNKSSVILDILYT